jgi:tRNA nucleotidyltransferase (CCA-adding enzyme)
LNAVDREVRRALRTASPAAEDRQRLGRIARLALARTRKAAEAFPEVRGVVLGGSYAKGTWLPESADVDIFVRLAVGTAEGRFEEAGLAVGAEAMRGYPRGKKYAQHPYTEALVEGVKVNVVPCFAVTGRRWMSAADRSPFHVKLVKAIPERQKAQVRLLKRFMRAVGVYGAEIETQGFSGYVAEVLVMRHGGFAGVLRSLASHRPGRDARPFTLPDPVDPARDLGMAVSGEKLGRLVLASREFLRRPRPEFFERMAGRARPEIEQSVLAVLFGHRRLSEDVLWGELRKTTRHVVRHVEARGFRVARAMAASNNRDRSALLLVPEFANLPSLEQRIGPTIDMRKETDSFLSSNRGRAKLVWVDDDARVRLLQEREYTHLGALLADIAKGRAGPVGASDEIAQGMAKSARVVSGETLRKLAQTQEWIANGIRDICSDAIGTSEA